MAINLSSLFTKLGKFAYAGQTIVAALGSSIEDEVEDAIQELGGSSSLEYEAIRTGIVPALRGLQGGAQGALAGCVVNPCRALVIQTVDDDAALVSPTLLNALSELISQMQSQWASLDASTVGATVAYDADNVGTGVLVVSLKRADGKVNAHILAESLSVTVITSSTDLSASLSVQGETAAPLLAYNWPLGSGASGTITSQSAAGGNNLVTNGGFETADTSVAQLPQGWIVSSGTVGVTIGLTNVAVQTVTMSGTPTAGSYLLTFTDRDGNAQTTAPLAYNATSAAVQSALRTLTGLGAVTVASSGTSPNLTHTVTFTGVPTPGLLASTNNTTGGTITHATVTAGSAYVLHGARSLQFASQEQTIAIQRPVTLTASTQYAVNLWACCDTVPVSGRLAVELVDGINGNVIQDDAGQQNSVHIPGTSLTSAFQSLSALCSSVNEQHKLQMTGEPSGGTFTLTFSGQTTGPITWDATATEVKTALEALSNIGTDDVSVSGGPLVDEVSSSSASSQSSSSSSSSSSPSSLSSRSSVSGDSFSTGSSQSSSVSSSSRSSSSASSQSSSSSSSSSSQSSSSASSSSSSSQSSSSSSSLSSSSSSSSQSSLSSSSSPSSSSSSSQSLSDSSLSSLSSQSSSSISTSSHSSLSSSSLSSSSSSSLSSTSSSSSSSSSSLSSSSSSSHSSSSSSSTSSSSSSLSSSSSSSLSSSSSYSSSSSSSAYTGTPIIITFQNALGGQDVPLITVNNANMLGGAVACEVYREGNTSSPTFRTPSVLPPTTYLRLRTVTPLSAGTKAYLDEVCLAPMTELYTGGPSMAAFAGRTNWSTNDKATITVTNDRAGTLHEWANRMFSLRENNLLLPTNASGNETISDSLVS